MLFSIRLNFKILLSATAQEVADAITSSLRSWEYLEAQSPTTTANGNYVQIISNTIGASSSVTVIGGSAENQLQFASVVPAGGNISTQWTFLCNPVDSSDLHGPADPIQILD